MTTPDPTLATVVEELRLLRAALTSERILVDARHAAEMLDISLTTFRSWVESEPGFPQSVRFGTFSDRRWRVADLRKWIAARPQKK